LAAEINELKTYAGLSLHVLQCAPDLVQPQIRASQRFPVPVGWIPAGQEYSFRNARPHLPHHPPSHVAISPGRAEGVEALFVDFIPE
jgi:hypothetical protein